MEKPLHQAGSYEIGVRLAGDLKPQITVVIEEEKETETEKKAEKKKEKGKKKEEEKD
jgi:hypothetical protein